MYESIPIIALISMLRRSRRRISRPGTGRPRCIN